MQKIFLSYPNKEVEIRFEVVEDRCSYFWIKDVDGDIYDYKHKFPYISFEEAKKQAKEYLNIRGQLIKNLL